MQWSDISFAPPSRTLRQFAGLWLVFFSALAAWQWLTGGNAWVVGCLAGLGLLVAGTGLLWPGSIRLVFVGCTLAAFPIGWVVSRLLLACLFYLLFTPIALAFRLLGRDALDLRRPGGVNSYWTVKPAPAGVRSYLQQF